MVKDLQKEKELSFLDYKKMKCCIYKKKSLFSVRHKAMKSVLGLLWLKYPV